MVRPLEVPLSLRQNQSYRVLMGRILMTYVPLAVVARALTPILLVGFNLVCVGTKTTMGMLDRTPRTGMIAVIRQREYAYCRRVPTAICA